MHFCHNNIILWKQESHFDIDFIVEVHFPAIWNSDFSKFLVTEDCGPLSRILKLTGCNVCKKLNPIVTELFIRARKVNVSCFYYQSYFAVPKDIRPNYMHYFIMKIPNNRELKQIASHISSDIDFKDIMNLYKNVLQNYILF